MSILAENLGLFDKMEWFIQKYPERPVLGTCAGLIFLAKRVAGQKKGGQRTLNVLDISVERNSYGSQLESFCAPVSSAVWGEMTVPFIRAPSIIGLDSDKVEPIAYLESQVVAVKQGSIIATAFHPELSESSAVHQYFLDLVSANHGLAN